MKASASGKRGVAAGTVLAERISAQAPAIRRFLAARVSAADVVDDLTQTTLEKALRKQGDLRDPARLTAWMLAIAGNELRQHWLHRRKKPWDLLEHEAAADETGAEARGDILRQFDAIIRRLASPRIVPRNLSVLALHFCLGWTAREIATATGENANTIATQIRRAKSTSRLDMDEPLSPEIDFRTKIRVIDVLWKAAAMPMHGNGTRDMELLRQAFAMLRMTSLQYPGEPWAVGMRMSMAFFLARAAADPESIQFLPEQDLSEWRRDAWDKRFHAEAIAAYQEFQRVAPGETMEVLRCNIEASYELLSPRELSAVRWERVLEKLEVSLRLQPRSDIALLYARVLEYRQGPSKALKFLETVRKQGALRENHACYYRLGRLYERLEQWDKAKRMYRTFLRWQHNPSWQERINEAIRRCDARE